MELLFDAYAVDASDDPLEKSPALLFAFAAAVAATAAAAAAPRPAHAAAAAAAIAMDARGDGGALTDTVDEASDGHVDSSSPHPSGTRRKAACASPGRYAASSAGLSWGQHSSSGGLTLTWGTSSAVVRPLLAGFFRLAAAFAAKALVRDWLPAAQREPKAPFSASEKRARRPAAPIGRVCDAGDAFRGRLSPEAVSCDAPEAGRGLAGSALAGCDERESLGKRDDPILGGADADLTEGRPIAENWPLGSAQGLRP